jgi:hypothetical protein
MSTPTDDRRELHESVTRGYEPRDVQMRWIVGFVILLLVSAVVIHTGSWFLLKGFVGGQPAVDQPPSVFRENVAKIPSQWVKSDAPPLQPTQRYDRVPPADVAAMHRQEDELLAAMGWTNDPVTHRPVVPASLAAVVAERAPATQAAVAAATAAAPSSPSPAAPGEGRGEGVLRASADDPHPNPLPEYREREQDAHLTSAPSVEGGHAD